MSSKPFLSTCAFLLLGHLAWLQMWQTHRGHGAVIAGCCVCSDGSVDGESSPSCSSLHMSTNQDDLLTDGALSINTHLYFRSPLTNSPSHTHRHTIIYMSYAQRKFWQSPHPKIDTMTCDRHLKKASITLWSHYITSSCWMSSDLRTTQESIKIWEVLHQGQWFILYIHLAFLALLKWTLTL